MTDIQTLIDALVEAQDARSDYRSKRERCYEDPDYYLHSEADRVETAEARLAAAFSEAVQAEVRKMLDSTPPTD